MLQSYFSPTLFALNCCAISALYKEPRVWPRVWWQQQSRPCSFTFNAQLCVCVCQHSVSPTAALGWILDLVLPGVHSVQFNTAC